MPAIKTFFTVVFWLACAPAFAQEQAQPKPKRLLLLDFSNQKSDPGLSYLENSIGPAVDAAMKGRYRYETISRDIWQAEAAKRKIANVDLSNENVVIPMAKVLNADGIIIGKFTANEEKTNVVIVGKIISVIDEDTLAEKTVSVAIDPNMFREIDDMSQVLAVKIRDLFFPTDRGALWRSALLPGWGQYYKQRPKWAIFWAGAVGTSLAVAGVFTATTLSYSSQYKSAGVDDDPAGLYSKWQSHYEIMRIAWYITALLYVANLADAYFFQGNYNQSAASAAAETPIKTRLEVQSDRIGYGRSYRDTGIYLSLGFDKVF